MAWTPYNSSIENYHLFSEAGQSTQNPNYNPEFFGYPPSALLPEDTTPLFTEDSLRDSLVQCPQPNGRADMGPGGVELHRLNSSTTSRPPIKFNEPKALVVDGISDSSAIWPHSLPATPSDSTGQISNQLQVVQQEYPRPSGKRGKPE
jgi:hypothetical protein